MRDYTVVLDWPGESDYGDCDAFIVTVQAEHKISAWRNALVMAWDKYSGAIGRMAIEGAGAPSESAKIEAAGRLLSVVAVFDGVCRVADI